MVNARALLCRCSLRRDCASSCCYRAGAHERSEWTASICKTLRCLWCLYAPSWHLHKIVLAISIIGLKVAASVRARIALQLTWKCLRIFADVWHSVWYWSDVSCCYRLIMFSGHSMAIPHSLLSEQNQPVRVLLIVVELGNWYLTLFHNIIAFRETSHPNTARYLTW